MICRSYNLLIHKWVIIAVHTQFFFMWFLHTGNNSYWVIGSYIRTMIDLQK